MTTSNHDWKRALEGAELQILNALGIDPPDGKGHIDCPYPRHGGKSDWRWDQAKSRAYCTCITNGGEGSHSIVDVVMQMRSDNFHQAKNFCLETIGRPDLIESSTAPSGEMRVMTTPESLLKPPQDYADHNLAKKYLAHRLGIDLDDVLMPDTRVAGWKRFPYFDPPPKGKKIPHRVGEFPCIGFETMSANGERRHAHRIYVGEEGSGKADLGKRTNGQKRDPKKSAKKESNDKDISGLAVWWGKRNSATQLYLCEGIETGQAIANSLKIEIMEGVSAVAAAISTSGVRALCPSDTIAEVVIAADRDEAPNHRGNVSRAGMLAARAFALRHHERIKIKIALPGVPDSNYDFLDLFRDKGISAVAECLARAEMFQPTRDEIDDNLKNRKVAQDIDRISQSYPLPEIEGAWLEYRHSARDGKVKLYKVTDWDRDTETGKLTAARWKAISSPFSVSHRIRYIDRQESYGLRVLVEDMNGRSRAIDFHRAKLAKMGGLSIRELLFAAGLRTYQDGIQLVIQICEAADPAGEVSVVSTPGWHQSPNAAPFFVSPGREVISCMDSIDIELTSGVGLDRAKAGSLEGQIEALDRLLLLPNCPHWHLGVAAGLAGVLIDLTGDASCGICLSGNTSVGKTWAQKVAASAWGPPELGDGLLRSMRTTPNALEGIAQLANGSVLTLDELAHAEDRQVAGMVYMIAGNEGKKRLNKDMEIRPGFRWRTFALLSSEHDLKKRVEDGGHAWMGGMSVRLPSVKVSGVNIAVSVETLQSVEAGLRANYGHIGPAFVQALIGDGLHRERQELKEHINWLAVELAGDRQGSTARAARPFALLHVAGSLARDWGVLPGSLDVEGAVRWAWTSFQDSDEASALSPEDRAIHELRLWIVERWNVTVKPVKPKVDAHGRIIDNNREALAWYDDDCIYMPKKRLVEASGKIMTELDIARKLETMGGLGRRHGDRRYVRGIPHQSGIDAYALKKAMFGKTEHPHLQDVSEGAA